MPLKISGLERFRALLPQAMDDGADQTADDLVSLEQQLAPKDTGDLASTVRKEGEPGTARRTVKVGEATGASGSYVDYQGHIEYGTAFSEAQPFVAPSVKAIDPRLRFKQAIKRLGEESTS